MVKHIHEGLRVGLRAACLSEHLCAPVGRVRKGGAVSLTRTTFLLASSPLHANATRTHLSTLMVSWAAFEIPVWKDLSLVEKFRVLSVGGGVNEVRRTRTLAKDGVWAVRLPSPHPTSCSQTCLCTGRGTTLSGPQWHPLCRKQPGQ